jgi:hypothetical protein
VFRPPEATPSPPLPAPRGPISDALLSALRDPPGRLATPRLADGDPVADDDLQLALYVSYELHYRSFHEVDPAWEWDPTHIAFRRSVARFFLGGVREIVPVRDGVAPQDVGELLFDLAEADDGPSLAEHLGTHGTLEQFREFVIHRSAYQLKEADPHTWAIPRLHGPPKAAMVEVQADEYGSGDPDRVHSTLFANAMDELGLDSAYGAYLDRLPGSTLATVNLISALGLDRAMRGALVGHLAMFEITSAIPNSRYAKGLRRLGLEGRALEFFDEHVEADSVHENVAAYDLAQGLARLEPGLTASIIFGAEALLALEARFAAPLIAAWDAGRSSLIATGDPVAA